MKKTLNTIGIVLGVLLMCVLMDATFIGLGLGVTKGIELLNIEVGLTKAVWVYVYFAAILIIYYACKELIKHRLVIEGKVNFKGQLIKDRDLNINIKRARIVYNIYAVCGSLVISWLLKQFDSVFVFFLILPVALFGINNGIEDASKMTFQEKEDFILEKEKYKGGE